jgi:hypothetical protein
MTLFGRKRTQENAAPDSAQYRLMLDLERSRAAAAMIAKSRASSVMEVADMVAGMYLSNWERLSRYWPEESHERIETFLRKICQISPQRWNSWIEFYDAERHRTGSAAGQFKWRDLLQKKNAAPPAARPSADLENVLERAQGIAPFRDTYDNRQLPVLTLECVLLCIVRTPDSEIAGRLIGSGLDTAKLEQEARNPRHAPIK